MEKLFDINEVCKMLGTTSRTLRFYEDKGIIQSTKENFSTRRKYTENQIEQIRNILVLRTLGISIKAISQLQRNDTDLKSAVLSKKAEIYASIETKIKEINLLNEAIAIIEQEKDIFSNPFGKTTVETVDRYKNIVKVCIDGILKHNFNILSDYCSSKILEYMPESAFWAMWGDTVRPAGQFVKLGKIVSDEKYPHIIYQYLEFENIGIKIKFVFYNDEISGLWTTYYEL